MACDGSVPVPESAVGEHDIVGEVVTAGIDIDDVAGIERVFGQQRAERRHRRGRRLTAVQIAAACRRVLAAGRRGVDVIHMDGRRRR